MRAFLLAVTAVTVASLLASPAAAQQGRYGRLYEALWSTVNENYYDPHFRGTDWAARRERYRARASAADSDRAFLAVANEMLEQIHSSHLFTRTRRFRV